MSLKYLVVNIFNNESLIIIDVEFIFKGKILGEIGV